MSGLKNQICEEVHRNQNCVGTNTAPDGGFRLLGDSGNDIGCWNECAWR